MRLKRIGLILIAASVVYAIVCVFLDTQGMFLIFLVLPVFLLGIKYDVAKSWRRGLFQAFLAPCFTLLGYEAIAGVLYPSVMGHTTPPISSSCSVLVLSMCCVGGWMVSMPAAFPRLVLLTFVVVMALYVCKITIYRIAAVLAVANYHGDSATAKGLVAVRLDQAIRLTIRDYGVALVDITEIGEHSVSYRWRFRKVMTERETSGFGHASEATIGGGCIHISTESADNCITVEDVRMPWLPGGPNIILLRCKSPKIIAEVMPDADFQQFELKVHDSFGVTIKE